MVYDGVARPELVCRHSKIAFYRLHPVFVKALQSNFASKVKKASNIYAPQFISMPGCHPVHMSPPFALLIDILQDALQNELTLAVGQIWQYNLGSYFYCNAV